MKPLILSLSIFASLFAPTSILARETATLSFGGIVVPSRGVIACLMQERKPIGANNYRKKDISQCKAKKTN